MGLKIGGIDVGAVMGNLATGNINGAVSEVAKDLGTAGANAALTDSFAGMSGPLQQTKVNIQPGVHGTNNTMGNRASASGPISAAEWADPSKLLSKLTQNPAGGANDLSHSTCGASNLLGAALMASPEHAARLCQNVAKNASTDQLSLSEKSELGQIGQRISNHTATFEDLNRAQSLLYKAGNTVSDPDTVVQQALDGHTLNAADQQELTNFTKQSSWSDADAARIAQLVSKATNTTTTFTKNGQGWDANVSGSLSNKNASGFTDGEEANLAKLGAMYTDPKQKVGGDYVLQDDVKTLKPGQSMTTRIVGQSADNGTGGNADHFVTIGRRTDGTWYMYNPDPGKGDSTMITGNKGDKPSADFMKQVSRYADRIPFDADGNMPSPLKYRQE
jgi:hypothetical protein